MHTVNGKIELLEDMSTSIIHVLNDTDYLRIYYPTDNAVINKDHLTLISPQYVSHLSSLLKLAPKNIELSNSSNDTVLPLKKRYLTKLKLTVDNQRKIVLVD